MRAAIAIADEGGLPALTMSAVAERLGSYTPMALYRYVHSKDGLVDLMLDAVTASIDIPEQPTGDWRADLHGVATRTWDVVKRHIWYAQLVSSRPPVGPHMLRRTEFILAALTRHGVPVTDAMTYLAVLDRYIIGVALQEAEERQMRARYGIASPEKFLAALEPVRKLAGADGRCPTFVRWLEAPSGPTLDEQFQLGLACLLDGFAARLPAS